MRRSVWLALVLLALLAALAAKSLLVQVPALRANSAAGEFDAQRAAERLSVILADDGPHPTDSVADDRVRGRIVALVAGMGLTPVVTNSLACNELYKARGVSCARVRNVIVVIGPVAGKALLLN
ncbi:MAG: hypothetical protein ACJ8FL_02165, partial [Sphingomicrobium sp.]